jgi:hypothetical protein
LKAVLLNNGNKLPSIPLAHAVHMKETCASIQGLLEKQPSQGQILPCQAVATTRKNGSR